MSRQTYRNLLTVGALIGAMGTSVAAIAADAAATDDTTLQEVVVTGFRSSLQKALDMKHEQSAEIDTILAEDIGKFPDANLAESLQRIPGVAITREGGEGREITVRGLGPQYTRTLINGMEALTTIGSPDNDGGVNRTRAFDFNVFSSDLFTEIDVHKTAEARVDEGSLGATIDLHSAHPLSLAKNTLILSGKEDYNDLAKSFGPRGGILASTKNDAGTLGVLVSLSASHRDLDNVGDSTVRWDEGNVLSTGGTSAKPLVGFGSVLGTNCQVNPLPAGCVAADSALHPRFPRYDLYREIQDRYGGSLALQFKPNDRHSMSLDYLKSYWAERRYEDYIEAPGFSGTGKCSSAATCTSIANIAVQSDTISPAGVMTGGTFNGVDARTEARYDEMHTNFNQVTLNSVDHWANRFWTDALLGLNTSRFANPIQTTIGWDQYNIQGFSYAFSGSSVPLLNFGNANLNSPGDWRLTEVRERPQTVNNDFSTAAGSLHFDMSDNLQLSAGASYKLYKYATTSLRLVNGESVTPTNAYSSLQSIANSSYAAPNNVVAGGVNPPPGSSLSWYSPSVALAVNALGGLYSSPLFALSTLGDLGNNAGIREADTGVFVQSDFKFQVFHQQFRGNLGWRSVTTDETSNGYDFVSNVLSPVVNNHRYTEGLPSANLAWDLTDNTVLRLGAARVMTRPDLGSLVGTTTVSVSGTSYSVKTGNPNLAPFLADSYDVAFEWYPSRGAIVSLAGFRKNIISLVATSTTNIPFTGNPFGIPDSAAVAACGTTPGCSPAATWAFSTPQNTSGGHVDGLELNVQQPFTFLPGFWSHFGALANLTVVNSSVSYPNGSGGYVQGQLLGLSKNAANATLYYEDERWSFRVSEAYRSSYLTKIPGTEVGTDADGFLPTHNVDASLQYSVGAHLKLTLEGVNLTNQQELEFTDTHRQLPYYDHQTGREILLGARYQL
ncbi:MAG: TonB-dependent receptor [Steroidobacteraceae bacterium]